MNQEQRIQELLQDSAFVEKVRSMETTAQIAEAFSANGVAVTEKDLEQAREALQADSELDELALENVSGGLGPLAVGAVVGVYYILAMLMLKLAMAKSR